MTGSSAAQAGSQRMWSNNHHKSHRRLVRNVPLPASISRVDAIVVPAARHAGHLKKAMRLAARLGCELVVLCSKESSFHAAAGLAIRIGARVTVIDAERLPRHLLPIQSASRMLRATPFERRTDTGMKRNAGLLFAALAGWRKVAFLDDDITVSNPGDLRRAATLLDEYSAVGFNVTGFYDNSVVCHAFREVGGRQDTFVGGGALLVRDTAFTSFFPEIYNEDWFFLLGGGILRGTALTSQVTQRWYDPFASVGRAEAEEFGDTLAEGVFSLLDHGLDVHDADLAYWDEAIKRRRAFIREIHGSIRMASLGDLGRGKMRAALEAAYRRNMTITPELCVDYLHGWRADLARWEEFVAEKKAQHAALGDPGKVIANLGLANCARYIERSEPGVPVALPHAEVFDENAARSQDEEVGWRESSPALAGATAR